MDLPLVGRWTQPQGVRVRRSDGRAYILCRDGSQTTFARAVAQNVLGHELSPGAVVHHINGDPTDDLPENLGVLESQTAHARNHGHSWRTSRWAERSCAGCGCDHDGRTRGCRWCYDRHKKRRLAQQSLFATEVACQ
jgi:hypothetical protein